MPDRITGGAEAVLLGAAMLGAVAAGHYAGLSEAMAAMSRAGRVIEPSRGPSAAITMRNMPCFSGCTPTSWPIAL